MAVIEIIIRIKKLSGLKPFFTPQAGAISPVIDGEVTYLCEWDNAGAYNAKSVTGAMRRVGEILETLRFGLDEFNLFLMMEFSEQISQDTSIEIYFRGENKPIIIINSVELYSEEM